MLSVDVSSTNVLLFIVLFPRLRISTAIKIADIQKANPSATGPEYKNPLIPNMLVNVIIAGIKNSTCLEEDNNALLTLFPIAWKNIPDGICIPFTMHNIK